MELKKVVLACILDNDLKVLAVSRRDNPEDFGFVGGKVDDGEDIDAALDREVLEETGLIIEDKFLFSTDIYKGNEVYTYMVTRISNLKSGELVSPEGLALKFVEPEVLWSEKASFKDFNYKRMQKVFEYINNHDIVKAYNSDNLETFLGLVLPDTWSSIGARVIETGVKFVEKCEWLIGVSDIPNTKRLGSTYLESAVKSTFFRFHDCMHQLWGIPFTSPDFTEEDFYVLKRAQMCGEVAVLTITEFMFGNYLRKTYPEFRGVINNRNSTPMMDRGGVMHGKTYVEIASRLDSILHRKIRPKWLRECPVATKFVDDYVPMLQRDRDNINANWDIMKTHKWIPNGAQNVRYSSNMDSLELTIWMIKDFEHMLHSDEKCDFELAEFNRKRRKRVTVPTEWVY